MRDSRDGDASRAVTGTRTEASPWFRLDSLGESVCLGVKRVGGKMWKSHLDVIAEKLNQAFLVLDRFHVMRKVQRTWTSEAPRLGVDEALNGLA